MRGRRQGGRKTAPWQARGGKRCVCEIKRGGDNSHNVQVERGKVTSGGRWGGGERGLVRRLGRKGGRAGVPERTLPTRTLHGQNTPCLTW